MTAVDVSHPAMVGRATPGAAWRRRPRLPPSPAGHLELRLLGPMELRRDGNLVDAPGWRRERVRSLLTYLVLHRTVSRTQMADALWPTFDAPSQSRNLRVTLTYLLQVLEPGRSRRAPSFFVRQHGNNIVLHDGDHLTVDLWELDRRCRQAAAADERGAAARVLEEATAALELWRGEPTDALSEPWAVSHLEHRRVRFAATALRAGELLLARNQLEAARDFAERALATDPWLEAAYRLLVVIHIASGDELAARCALSRYRAVVDQLGVDPGEAGRMVERMLASALERQPLAGR